MESLAVQSSPPIRASDEDRARTVAILGEHYRAGRLDTEEFEARCEEAWGAKMISALWTAVRELPLAPPPAVRPSTPSAPGTNSAVSGFVAAVVASCLLLLTFGVASVLTTPLSGLAWWLGRRGRKLGAAGPHRGLAQAAEVLGVLGVAIGALALVFWMNVISGNG